MGLMLGKVILLLQMTKGKKYYHHYSQNMPALQRAKQANFKILRQLSDGIDI
jgi:hypothetical protein